MIEDRLGTTSDYERLELNLIYIFWTTDSAIWNGPAKIKKIVVFWLLKVIVC